MKIGVVSDTHSLEVPQQLVEDFKTVDVIVHAGDFCTQEDFNIFAKIKEVKAVYGNMDDSDLREKLPETLMLSYEGKQLGVFHGEGPAKKVLDSVRRKFQNSKTDIIIFGHSHQPMNELIDHVLYFNPGSPNDKTYAPYRSYGIIEINNGTVKGHIIKVKDHG